MPAFAVRRVPPEDTRALRQAVLRPHQRPEDLAAHEHEGTIAVGAFAGDELIAVGLVGPEGGPGAWRVRGMATAPHARGQGAGAAVLRALVEHAQAQGVTRLWANVRVPAVSLYERAGFAVVSEKFELPQIGPHVVMERRYGRPMNPDASLVRLSGVRKVFDDNVVLNGIDLDIARGEAIVVAGPSGSGKSTMLRCINGLETIDDGTITFDGQPVGGSGRELSRLRAEIGMVFQQFNLFPHMTVERNVTLAPVKVKGISEEKAKTRARELLERVGIPEKAGAYPADLSGGQQQRVAIARALAMDPKLMLFDEPTSALDPEMIREVLDVMRDLAGTGMTMVVVTHEMGFAREVCDRIVFIDEGEIVEEGPPKEFFTAARSERAREFVDKIIHH